MLRNLNQSYSFGRICGTPFVGIEGALIPADGDAGPSVIYNSISLPGDDAVQFMARPRSIPIGLALVLNEDGTGTADGDDGVYVVDFDLWGNNVARDPFAIQFTFGNGEAIVCTPGNAVAAGVQATISLATRVGAQPGNAVANGVQASIGIGVTLRCAPAVAIAAGVRANVSGGGIPAGDFGGPFNIIIRRRRR